MRYEAEELSKIYYDVIAALQTDKRFIILWGGRSSGKSVAVYQAVIKVLWNTSINAIFYRSLVTVLNSAAFVPITDILKKKGVYARRDVSGKKKNHCAGVFNLNGEKMVEFPKGNKLYFKGASKEDNIKGDSNNNVRLIIIDEVDQLTKEIFLTLQSTFRGVGEVDVKFIIMFNPVWEKHWLKGLFFDAPEESEFKRNAIRLHYTCEDNRFLKAEDIRLLDSLQFTDINRYNVDRLGLWGTLSVTDPFLFNFRYNVHTRESVPFFERLDYPVYVSFDFGSIDSAVLGQRFSQEEILYDDELRGYFSEDYPAKTTIREYRQKDNSEGTGIHNIVKLIIEEFGIEREYRITGDSAGGGANTYYGKFQEIYYNFADVYGAYKVELVSRLKPTQLDSQTISNWVMSTYKSNFLIDRTCSGLVNDYLKVGTVVSNSGKVSIDKSNKEIGHLFDAQRYYDFLTEKMHFYDNSRGYYDRSGKFNKPIQI